MTGGEARRVRDISISGMPEADSEDERRLRFVGIILHAWWQFHMGSTDAEIRTAVHRASQMVGLCVEREGTIEIQKVDDDRSDVVLVNWSWAYLND